MLKHLKKQIATSRKSIKSNQNNICGNSSGTFIAFFEKVLPFEISVVSRKHFKNYSCTYPQINKKKMQFVVSK